MPTPTSISSGPSSKIGRALAGVAQDVSATPNERARSLTIRAASATWARVPPASARAPAIFSASTVAPDAAAPGGVERVLDGAVVVHDHARHLDAVVLGELGREAEVEHVAGVVLDDVQDARAAVDGLRGRLHLIRHRRGEDRAGAGRVEHARADEAAVQGLVPRAAARDEPDLAGDGRVGADDQLLVEVDPHEAGVRACDARERLGHDVLGIVHELLHGLRCDAHDDALLGCR